MDQVLPENISPEEEEEEFEDAIEDNDFDEDTDRQWDAMEISILHVEECLKMFLNSDFISAQEGLKCQCQESLYHSLGYAVITMMKSLMTFDPKDIQLALSLIKDTLNMAYGMRRQPNVVNSIARTIKGISVNELRKMSRGELHAELVHAEATLIKAVLTLIADDGTGFMTFVKEGLSFRNSYMTYNAFQKLINTKENGEIDYENIPFDPHFVSGVAFGGGMFNVMLSLLPSRILKVFELIGFYGKRNYGLMLLENALQRPGLRSELCSLALLTFHSLIGSHVGLNDCDINVSIRILNRALTLYPKSAFFLFFNGQTFYSLGRLNDAIVEYEKSIASQQEWTQLHHICYWEMALAYNYQLKFDQGLISINLLKEQSNWSKTVYTYYLAILNYHSNYPNPSLQVLELMEQVPTNRQKIAGKSIPLEKFMCRKARKFAEQGNELVLPIFELLIIWNGAKNVPEEGRLMAMSMIEKEMIRVNSGSRKHYYDDVCLLLLSRATFTLYSNDKELCEQSLLKLFEIEKSIELDHWMAPYAHLTYAKLLIMLQRFDEASDQLKIAKKNYKHYSLENATHLKIHNCRMNLELAQKQQIESDDEQVSENSFE